MGNKIITDYTIRARLDKGSIKEDALEIQKYIEKINNNSIDLKFNTSDLKEVEKIIKELSNGSAEIESIFRAGIKKSAEYNLGKDIKRLEKLSEISTGRKREDIVNDYEAIIGNVLNTAREKNGQIWEDQAAELREILAQAKSLDLINKGKKGYRSIYNEIKASMTSVFESVGSTNEQTWGLIKDLQNNSIKPIDLRGFKNVEDALKSAREFLETISNWADGISNIEIKNPKNNKSNQDINTINTDIIKAKTIHADEIITGDSGNTKGSKPAKSDFKGLIDVFANVLDDGNFLLHRGYVDKRTGDAGIITRGESMDVIFQHAMETDLINNVLSAYGINGTSLYATRNMDSVIGTKGKGEKYYVIQPDDLNRLLKLNNYKNESLLVEALGKTKFGYKDIPDLFSDKSSDAFYTFLQSKLQAYMSYIGLNKNGVLAEELKDSLINVYGFDKELLNDKESSIQSVANYFFKEYEEMLSSTEHNNVTREDFERFFREQLRIQEDFFKEVGTVERYDPVNKKFVYPKEKVTEENYQHWRGNPEVFGWQSKYKAPQSSILGDLYGLAGVIPSNNSFLDSYYHGGAFFNFEESWNRAETASENIAFLWQQILESLYENKQKGLHGDELINATLDQLHGSYRSSTILDKIISGGRNDESMIKMLIDSLKNALPNLDENAIRTIIENTIKSLPANDKDNSFIARNNLFAEIQKYEGLHGETDTTQLLRTTNFRNPLLGLQHEDIQDVINQINNSIYGAIKENLKSILAIIDNAKSNEISDGEIENKWANFKAIVNSIKGNIDNYENYLYVISELMETVGSSDLGEVAYNGLKGINYHKGGEVRTPSNLKMGVDYHSHPNVGYDDAAPSRQDIVSYFKTIDNQLEKYGEAYLKRAYISSGDKLLEIGFDNIDWSKINTKDLQNEIDRVVGDAITKAGGSVGKNANGATEWYVTNDIITNDKIAKAERGALSEVLEKYGGTVRLATRNEIGQLIDDKTGESWSADVKGIGIFNQSTDKFDNAVDKFNGSVEESLNTRNAKPINPAPQNTPDPVSDNDIDNLLSKVSNAIIKTNGTNSGNGISSGIVEARLIKLKELIETFASGDKLNTGRFQSYVNNFNDLNKIIQKIGTNKAAFNNLVNIQKQLNELESQGKTNTVAYKKLLAQKNHDASRYVVGNNLGTDLNNKDAKNLLKMIEDEAALQNASKMYDTLLSKQSKLRDVVEARRDKGVEYKQGFINSYENLNTVIDNQLQQLTNILEGTFVGDVSTLFKAVVKAIEDIDDKTVKATRSESVSDLIKMSSKDIDDMKAQYERLLVSDVVKGNKGLYNEIVQNMDNLNSYKPAGNNAYLATNLYEGLVDTQDELKNRVSTLEKINSLYKDTYNIRRELITLKANKSDDIDYLNQLESKLEEVKNTMYNLARTNGIDSSYVDSIIGDKSDYQKYANELIKRIETQQRQIRSSMIRKQNQGYGYTKEFQNEVESQRNSSEMIIKQLRRISDAGEDAGKILQNTIKLIQSLDAQFVDVQADENVTVKRNQLSSLFASAQALKDNTRVRGVSDKDRATINALYFELKQLEDEAENAGGQMTSLNRIRYNQIATQIQDLTTKYKELGIYGSNTLTKIGKSIKAQTRSAIARYFSLYDIIRYARTGINTIKELDTAMVELRKVTDGTAKEYADFQKTIRATAVDIASTNQSLISSAADWA